MLLFVNTAAHGFEGPFLLDLLDERSVDDEVAERRGVFVAASCCGAGEVVVVGGADKEDAFTKSRVRRRLIGVNGRLDVRIRPVGTLVGPCCSRPGVRVAGVPVSMSLTSSPSVFMVAHGAMIARAFGVGIETSPCCEDVEPMGVVERGTASSQPSSCRESCWPLAVYHEPAWEGLRVTILR
jgi:hypothetical protein